MPVALLPDVVTMLRAYLLEQDDITAIVGQRIRTSSPTDTTRPWIRLSRVGGPRSESAPMRIDVASIQVDCFAPHPKVAAAGVLSGDLGAATMARTVRAYLDPFVIANWSDDQGVITNARETLGPQNQPDTSRTPPTARVHFTVAITARTP